MSSPRGGGEWVRVVTSLAWRFLPQLHGEGKAGAVTVREEATVFLQLPRRHDSPAAFVLGSGALRALGDVPNLSWGTEAQEVTESMKSPKEYEVTERNSSFMERSVLWKSGTVRVKKGWM